MIVNSPSSVVSPGSVPVASRKACNTSSPPQMLQGTFVQTWMKYRPTGRRLYME